MYVNVVYLSPCNTGSWREGESPVLGIDNVTGTVRSTRRDFSGVLGRLLAQVVSFVTCIRWMSGSNLDLDREYPDVSLS